MDEITKDAGHRASVSMPSLDSTDYFSTDTGTAAEDSTSTEFVVRGDSFTTTAPSSSLPSQPPLKDTTNLDEGENTVELADAHFITPPTTSTEDLVVGDSAFIHTNSVATPLSAQDLISGGPTEGLDDSQVEEDPSIAIDQFIKKIADEQLSSKRIEERKEEDESAPIFDTKHNDDKVEFDPNLTDDSLSQTAPSEGKNDDKGEPMDVDKVADDSHDGHLESIEEIQKEMAKIPPKKLDKDGTVASENNTEESIADILENNEDDTRILKNALEKNSKSPTIEDTAEVAKDPDLIQKAQEDYKKFDLLVCGECHNTFYFIEEFSEHKNGQCPQTSDLVGSCESEGKSQVWGYVLWKIKQTKDGTNNVTSDWPLYQKWCKLPQSYKDAWTTAGQSIQFATKIGNAKVTEARPGRPPKTMVEKKIIDSKPTIEYTVDSNKENSDMDGSNILKKSFAKPVKLNSDVTIIPTTKKEEFVVEKIMAKRFNPRKKTWEYNIKWENFGHDSNTWEPVGNLSHCKKLLDQFEEQLKRMKEEKAKLQQTTPKGRGRPPGSKLMKHSSNYVPIAPKNMTSLDEYGSGSRPVRTSKQRAMNQVKQWCGSISDEDSSSGVKRKYDSDESDDDFDDKKMKMEEDSDDSGQGGKPRIIKRVQGKPVSSVKNGSNQILPSNILIPDANGVVRINQKQLPALSSGVYIMSRTAGIIKLDSNTSKVATSGGQTIVKVAPKIGQTQIKIVKKDGNTTKQIIQLSPKTSISSTPAKVTPSSAKSGSAQKYITKIRREFKKSTGDKKFDSAADSASGPESDSDDGLEPLPFPGPDEPMPEDLTEEKQEEFVLDPETGKIAGLEYVDKPVVIKEEPAPVRPTTNELENIVTMAAADLADEDGESQDELFISNGKQVKTVTQTVTTPGGPTIRRVVRYSVGGQAARNEVVSNSLGRTVVRGGPPRPITSSINKAGPQLQQRRIVQQKVINSTVGARPNQPTRTVVRHVIEPSRPGQGSNINVIRKTVTTSTPKPKFNLSAQKPLPSPLQPTRTYSAMGGIRQSPGSKVQVYSAKSGIAANQTTSQQGMVRKIGSSVVRPSGPQSTVTRPGQQIAGQRPPVTRIIQRSGTSPKKPQQQLLSNNVPRQVASSKQRSVINMPSLTEDDIVPTLASKTAKQSAAVQQKPVLQFKNDESGAEESQQVAAETAEATAEQTDWSSFTMADTENPIYVTGDDGTIYQVAGQNEQGQTILITQGPDGQQQCLLVTNEIGEMMPDEPQPSTSTAEAKLPESPNESVTTPVQAQEELSDQATVVEAPVDDSVQTPLQIKTDDVELATMEEVEGMQDQVVAQVVRAEPPSPGGTHKVVVMLPDGNLMVTQVSAEEFASLELE